MDPINAVIIAEPVIETVTEVVASNTDLVIEAVAEFAKANPVATIIVVGTATAGAAIVAGYYSAPFIRRNVNWAWDGLVGYIHELTAPSEPAIAPEA